MKVSFSNHLSEQIQEDRIIPDITYSVSKRYKYFLAKKDIELEEVLLKLKD